MFNLRTLVLALTGWSVLSAAATFTEDFSSDPLQRGWQTAGNASLFAWDSAHQDLSVTWDSSKPNSYFYRPLGTILTTNDAFSLEFDLQLSSAYATNYSSQLAVGFLRLSDATSANFLRTSGSSPNVAEFDYFPPANLAASIDATLIDRSNNFYFVYSTAPLNNGQVYHIRLGHDAGGTTLSGQVLVNGQSYAALTNVNGAIGADFRLDVVAIASYQDDGYGDSILVQGTVDNMVVTVPPPPVQNFSGTLQNGVWQGQFLSQTNWSYTLQRTGNFQSWTTVSAATPGNGGMVVLQENSPASGPAFYRVVAQRP